MATIAMIHNGFKGHLFPALRLGAVLIGHGHRVVGYGPSEDRAWIEGSGALFRAHEPVSARLVAQAPEYAAILAAAAEACLGGLIEELNDDGTDLVIHDC